MHDDAEFILILLDKAQLQDWAHRNRIAENSSENGGDRRAREEMDMSNMVFHKVWIWFLVSS